MDEEKRSEWPEVIGAIALVCLLASLGLVAAGGWSWFAKFLESSAPAWVQALGSVGAIFIAGWAVQRSHRLQREQKAREAEEEYVRLLDVAFHLVGRVRVIATKIQGFEMLGPTSEASRRAMHAELATWLDAFKRFDVHRLELYEHVRAVLAGEAYARQLLAILDADFADHPSPVGNELQTQAANVVDSLTAHLQRLDEALKSRAAPRERRTGTL